MSKTIETLILFTSCQIESQNQKKTSVKVSTPVTQLAEVNANDYLPTASDILSHMSIRVLEDRIAELERVAHVLQKGFSTSIGQHMSAFDCRK